MSFSTILSAAIDGLGVELVRVEADVSTASRCFIWWAICRQR